MRLLRWNRPTPVPSSSVNHLEDPQQLFPVLRGHWHYYQVRAEMQTAHALGEQLLSLAQQAQDPAMLLAAHVALGRTLFLLGAQPLRTHTLHKVWHSTTPSNTALLCSSMERMRV